MLDKDGSLIFYGPLNYYQFYNDNVCISFLNLVQREDWYVYINKEQSDDQLYIKSGISVANEYCYNWSSLSFLIKNELDICNKIFGIDIEEK